MPLAVAVARATPTKTSVCTATLGTPASSNNIASPTTVGLQVLHKPTPRIAPSPSRATLARISASSTQLCRGWISRVLTDGRFLPNQSSSSHEVLGIVEQTIDEIDELA